MVLPTSVRDPKMPSTFICIYCTLSKPDDQRSKEHLLQRSLGGDLTAQFVCRDCNSEFSKIDQALSDRSTVTLSRVANTPSSAHGVKAGGIATYYDKDRDLFIEVELRNQFTVSVLPQFHLRANGQSPTSVDANWWLLVHLPATTAFSSWCSGKIIQSAVMRPGKPRLPEKWNFLVSGNAPGLIP
jgi:hypothetical protein